MEYNRESAVEECNRNEVPMKLKSLTLASFCTLDYFLNLDLLSCITYVHASPVGYSWLHWQLNLIPRLSYAVLVLQAANAVVRGPGYKAADKNFWPVLWLEQSQVQQISCCFHNSNCMVNSNFNIQNCKFSSTMHQRRL